MDVTLCIKASLQIIFILCYTCIFTKNININNILNFVFILFEDSN